LAGEILEHKRKHFEIIDFRYHQSFSFSDLATGLQQLYTKLEKRRGKNIYCWDKSQKNKNVIELCFSPVYNLFSAIVPPNESRLDSFIP
jgi:hypothetical protein